MSTTTAPANGKKEWMTPSGILVAVSLMAGLWGLVIKPMMDEDGRIDAKVAVIQSEHSRRVESLQSQITVLEANQVRIASAVTADSELKYQRVDEVYALLQMIYPRVMGVTLPTHTQYMNVNPELRGYTGTGQ